MLIILKLGSFFKIHSLLRQRKLSHQPFIQRAHLSGFIEKIRIIFIQPESTDQISFSLENLLELTGIQKFLNNK